MPHALYPSESPFSDVERILFFTLHYCVFWNLPPFNGHNLQTTHNMTGRTHRFKFSNHMKSTTKWKVLICQFTYICTFFSMNLGSWTRFAWLPNMLTRNLRHREHGVRNDYNFTKSKFQCTPLSSSRFFEVGFPPRTRSPQNLCPA